MSGSTAQWSVEAAARETPNTTALITACGRYTYAELVPMVRAAAAALADEGVDAFAAEPGRVMMVAPNRIETIVALLALFERGVPVMLMHPRSTRAERDALARAYPPAVRLDDGPPPLRAPPERWPGWPEAPREVPETRDLAIFFTSGTTGRPKAVRLSRRAFRASAAASARNLGWRAGDRWLLSIPIAHVGGMSILTRCLLARRTVVLGQGPSSPEALAPICRANAVTMMSLVPTQLKRWLPRPPPPALRVALIGGADLPDGLRADARARGWPILATYGLTEACSQVTVQRFGQTAGADAGWPLPGTEVQIRQGRIHVRGPTLLTGYVAPADGPAPPAPFDAQGWFDTGDLGRLTPDGRLLVDARRQDLILSGGENVYPKEVEAVLLGHPGVEEAVVFGLEDPEWGQVVAAAIVPARGGVDLRALSAALRDVLAGPKRPRRWAVFERFALTPSGKVDRRRAMNEARARLVNDPRIEERRSG